mmetsp:Transcript_35124/g.39933  ORF Transcript_35124/g.39933 Transcript_35124/m.39933 type:complete len:87 (+) Transcript_35124:1780-2040(+)
MPLSLKVEDFHGCEVLPFSILSLLRFSQDGGKNLHLRDFLVAFSIFPILPTAAKKTGLSGFEIFFCRATIRAMFSGGPSMGKYGFG